MSFFSRMPRFSIAAGLLLLLMAPLASRAQDANPDARSITLNEAVDIALRQSIPLQRAENNLERRRIAVASERMDFAPSLSASVGGSQSYGRSFVQNEGQVVNQTTSGMDAGVRANINLFNGFADVASLEAAKRNAESGRYSLARSREDVIFQVIQHYLTLIENREQVQIQEKNVQARESRLAQINEGVEVGNLPASDLYRQQAQVASAERDLLRAQHAFQLSVLRLQQLLQLDPDGVYEFTAPPLDETPAAAQVANVSQLLRTAYERRSDIEAQRLSMQATRQQVRAARSGYWPSIGLSFGYGSTYSNAIPLAFQDQFADRNRGGSISLSLSVPIFDRMQTHHTVQEQEVAYRNAELEMQQLRDEVALEVRQAYLDYQMAQKELDVTAKQVAAAERALRAEEARYDAGLTTLVALNEAQASYVQATSDQIATRYAYLFRQKLLDYYTGRLQAERIFGVDS